MSSQVSCQAVTFFRFQVEAHTNPGDTIFLYGSCQSLGKWDKSKARKLSCEGTYPIWSCEISIGLDELATPIEYMFLQDVQGKFRIELDGKGGTITDGVEPGNALEENEIKLWFRRRRAANAKWVKRLELVNSRQDKQITLIVDHLSELARLEDLQKQQVLMEKLQEQISEQYHQIRKIQELASDASNQLQRITMLEDAQQKLEGQLQSKAKWATKEARDAREEMLKKIHSSQTLMLQKANQLEEKAEKAEKVRDAQLSVQLEEHKKQVKVHLGTLRRSTGISSREFDAWKAEEKVWKTETIQRLLKRIEAIEKSGLHQLVELRSLSLHDSTDFLRLEEKTGTTEATLPSDAEEVDDGQEQSTHVLPDECRPTPPTADAGFSRPLRPEDAPSAQKTLEVERKLFAARNEHQSVAERRKRLKEAHLTLHPDKGGTDAAMIWFKDWLKEHIEWYFEPDTVPENLKKQYQEDEVSACPKVV